MFVLKFSLAGADQVMRTFNRFAEGVTDVSEAFEDIADDFLQLEDRQFSSQGAEGSGGWKVLSTAYAAWKERYYPGARILERDGWLRASLTQKNAPYGIREISATKLELGTTVPYGMWHQTGTDEMPARPPIQLNDDDKRHWGKLVHEYLYQLARAGAADVAAMRGVEAMTRE
ncbi:MAG: phage virion morphogenesis protein [Anaerolineae bacterium]